jgi:hypothetical protein
VADGVKQSLFGVGIGCSSQIPYATVRWDQDTSSAALSNPPRAAPAAAPTAPAARPQASVLSVPGSAGRLLPRCGAGWGLARGRGAEARGRWKRPFILPKLSSAKTPAQFIAVCSASTLAEKRSISSLLRGQTRAKRGALSRPTRAHVYELQPTTNSDKLSDHHNILLPLLADLPTASSLATQLRRYDHFPQLPMMVIGRVAQAAEVEARAVVENPARV